MNDEVEDGVAVAAGVDVAAAVVGEVVDDIVFSSAVIVFIKRKTSMRNRGRMDVLPFILNVIGG